MQTKSDTFFAYANKFRLYPIVIGSLYFDLSLFLQGRVLLVGLFVCFLQALASFSSVPRNCVEKKGTFAINRNNVK